MVTWDRGRDEMNVPVWWPRNFTDFFFFLCLACSSFVNLMGDIVAPYGCSRCYWYPSASLRT